MKGYWLILGTEVTDPEAQAEYGRLWAPIAARYGARLISSGSSLDLREPMDTARMLLVEFADLATARTCYEDPAYQAAMALTHKATRRRLVILEGNIG